MSSITQTCPPDILLEIVSHVLPFCPTSPGPPHHFKQRHSALTRLRLVCVYWDAVITSNPAFWSTIYTVFPLQTIPSSILELWMTRSLTASLAVSLIEDTLVPPTMRDRSDVDHTLATLSSHMSRVTELQVDVSVGNLPSVLNGFHHHPRMERLERFAINMRGAIDDHTHSSLLRQLTLLDSLREISFTSHCSSVANFVFQYAEPNWFSQLTSLEIRCPLKVHELVELMKKCSSATHIATGHISRCSERPLSTTPKGIAPTALPALLSLEISIRSHAYQYLAHYISLPNLQSLRISGVDIADLSEPTSRSTPTIGSGSSSPSHLHCLHATLDLSTELDSSIPKLCTLITTPSMLRIPIVEIESRTYECWLDHEGWLEPTIVENHSTREAMRDMEHRLGEAIKDFHKSHSGAGPREIRCHLLSEWGRQSGYFVGWTDRG